MFIDMSVLSRVPGCIFMYICIVPVPYTYTIWLLQGEAGVSGSQGEKGRHHHSENGQRLDGQVGHMQRHLSTFSVTWAALFNP